MMNIALNIQYKDGTKDDSYQKDANYFLITLRIQPFLCIAGQLDCLINWLALTDLHMIHHYVLFVV